MCFWQYRSLDRVLKNPCTKHLKMPDKVHFHFSVCIVELSQEGGRKSLGVLLIPGGSELLFHGPRMGQTGDS